eukprot:CAMPEP_0174862620 /NCGR_PEP_ID=MMETSP1114-20130205/54523_1 /TAXON_ID=312471 /ORGANISM="Neobodo designis, Strain CCAP 1951/1" /LENGTH=144 /DNA_ID=CAMNT_0016097671 /DNA_START=204 /DNA_END=636 /DNA_ORIENTATION=-
MSSPTTPVSHVAHGGFAAPFCDRAGRLTFASREEDLIDVTPARPSCFMKSAPFCRSNGMKASASGSAASSSRPTLEGMGAPLTCAVRAGIFGVHEAGLVDYSRLLSVSHTLRALRLTCRSTSVFADIFHLHALRMDAASGHREA